MWKKAKVKMEFSGRLCGSVPLQKEMVDNWLHARMPNEKPDGGKSLEEIKAEILESIEDIQEKITLGFQGDRNGLFVRGGTIKAHIKDCANQIKDAIKPQIKALRSKVANKVYIEDYYIYLKKNGKMVMEVDGEYDQPVHVITMQGPRNALKKIRYLEKPVLEFGLRLLEDKEIDSKCLEEIFKYGSIHGYGGERGMGEGRYDFEIKWE